MKNLLTDANLAYWVIGGMIAVALLALKIYLRHKRP